MDGATPLGDAELLHLETRCWTHCSTVNRGPPPRGNPTLVYSARRHLAIVYGGWDRRELLGDAWCLDLEAWRWHEGPASQPAGKLQGKPQGKLQGKPDAGEGGPDARTDHTAVL